jgi:hypothetical protein
MPGEQGALMTHERFVEPEVLQALEETREQLSAEQRALEALPRERNELLSRLEKLQEERTRVLAELEALKKGPRKKPRLPERLEAPFELQPVVSSWPTLREVVPGLFLLVALLVVGGTGDWFGMGLATLLTLAMMVKPSSDRKALCPRWHFGESVLTEKMGKKLELIVPYAKVLDVDVRISYSQHRRGVGTVVIRCKPGKDEREGQRLALKNVPEPERLAEWIRSKRTRGE